MKLKHRRIYYSTFIGIFLILTPIIFLYALGYRYDWPRQTFYKIGAVKLDSEPGRADIFLNDELVGKTDDLIQNLKPGFYSIKVSKEGYLPWQKEVEVLAAQTTIYEDITLFKENQSSEVLLERFLNYAISNDKTKIAYQDTNGKIWVGGLSEEMDEINLGQYFNIKNFSWSANDTRVLITTSGDIPQYFIVEINQLDQVNKLPSSNPYATLSNLKWDLNNDSSIYFVSNRQIHRLANRDNSLSSTKIFDFTILDYLPRDDDLYILGQDSSGVTLYLDDWTNRPIEEIVQIPDSSNISFLPQRFDLGLLFLNDIDNKRTNIFQTETKTILEQIPLAFRGFVSDNQRYVLLSDWHELWVWDIKQQKSYLLTRLTSNIEDAVLFDGFQYALFANENTIKAIEFDSRNRQIQDIWQIDNVESLGSITELFMPNKNHLYFIEMMPTKVATYNLVKLTIH